MMFQVQFVLYVANKTAIFGVMAQEPDLAPVDIVYNYTPQQFEQFITQKLLNSPFFLIE